MPTLPSTKNLPLATQFIFDQIPEIKNLYMVLRRADQNVLDSFFEAIFQHQEIISSVDNMPPIEVLPFAILLEEHKRMNEALGQLLSRIEKLHTMINLLP
jgi:hypothetical protein